MSPTTSGTCSTSSACPGHFRKRPRLTIYRRELYDYAECLNLAALLRGRFPELDAILAAVLARRTRPLAEARTAPSGPASSSRGWDNVPMHRWAQVADVSEPLALA